jgi:hypothetical protein
MAGLRTRDLRVTRSIVIYVYVYCILITFAIQGLTVGIICVGNKLLVREYHAIKRPIERVFELHALNLLIRLFHFRFMEPAIIVCLGGILPFGSIFIEM